MNNMLNTNCLSIFQSKPCFEFAFGCAPYTHTHKDGSALKDEHSWMGVCLLGATLQRGYCNLNFEIT